MARDVYAVVERYLRAEGVDVARALDAVERRRECETSRTRAAADRARDLALDLKAAERALLHEARGLNEGCAGFTAARLHEAEARAAHLRAALEAACCDDPVLARTVARSVA
jgi:hypothetical protein